jgi:hypothetical protein
MSGDMDLLEELNMRIGMAESEGDKAFLRDEVLAPVLAFRRANGLCVDRETFLKEVKPSPRRETKIESISLLGRERAIVTCIVAMDVGGEKKEFHNFRLFVRSGDGKWRLLGWANEAA